MNSVKLSQAIRYRHLIRADSHWLLIIGLVVTIVAVIIDLAYNSSFHKPVVRTYAIDAAMIIGVLMLGVGVNDSVVPFIPYSAAKTDEQLIHNSHAIKTDKWEMNISAGPGVDVPGSYESKNESSSNNDMMKRVRFDKAHQPQKSLLIKL